MKRLSIEALKARYYQTSVGILQASIYSFGWLFRFLGPAHKDDWGVWVWVALGWVVLPGMGYWRDRKAHLKKRTEDQAG